MSTTTPSVWPRFRAAARRPKWIAVLLLCLAVAAVFAALGQWQLERSIRESETTPVDTETAVPIERVAAPREPVTEDQLGRTVRVSGELVAGDFDVLVQRQDVAGEGAWLVGHLVTADGASLAVALGFAEDVDAARAAVAVADAAAGEPLDLVGRYLPSESPSDSDLESGQRRAMAVPEQLNRWAEPDRDVYAGYLIAAEVPDGIGGLDAIHAPAPERATTLNLLNLFYAIEWAIFAGFAIYIWYRLVRDEVEKELEEDLTKTHSPVS